MYYGLNIQSAYETQKLVRRPWRTDVLAFSTLSIVSITFYTVEACLMRTWQH
ncbi:uncharacterized protein EURHEDRAFT_411768 [Aspergillus ruber CBS 135680]|uniref:Uncharacterized protein n=1 Tax=Aspergillus ruber (strain CBS 135680) TaxID=1388766 RepID=A0A017SGG7_ASPRC|nr:uncharacterized protein EURHEDRAFT_411768 [Aspergillus ruber CBS 135680]EYE96027.1 hypothetical protein EURHEDRAFT_411768 [Aspergillus ruber CBS 135680]